MPHSRHPLRAAFSLLLCGLSLSVIAGCAQRAPSSDAHADHRPEVSAASAGDVSPSDSALPAGATDVAQRLASSPRHGEYVMIPTGAGDSVRAWVVYPERSTKAPVVVVVHEI